VYGLRFRVWGLGLRSQDQRSKGSGLMVYDLGYLGDSASTLMRRGTIQSSVHTYAVSGLWLQFKI
jgi:hypothetical protein